MLTDVFRGVLFFMGCVLAYQCVTNIRAGLAARHSLPNKNLDYPPAISGRADITVGAVFGLLALVGFWAALFSPW